VPDHNHLLPDAGEDCDELGLLMPPACAKKPIGTQYVENIQYALIVADCPKCGAQMDTHFRHSHPPGRDAYWAKFLDAMRCPECEYLAPVPLCVLDKMVAYGEGEVVPPDPDYGGVEDLSWDNDPLDYE